MEYHILLYSVFILAINVFAVPKNDLEIRIKAMISDEDRALFERPEGLWFADDDDQLVQATLEIPIESEFFFDPEDKVSFYLYTKYVLEPDILKINDVYSLQKSHFNASKPTKFVTHGWVNSKNSRACKLPKDAYLIHEDYNVVVVDWSKVTMRPYTWSAVHVKSVGQHVAKMIDFLVSQGASLDTMTLVGHSLGAHVMGIAGFHSKGTVNYIVGLDPALPMFASLLASDRISLDDARYVEIIHTNAGLLGYLLPIGTADFYPNGGTKQTDCSIDLSGHCSHCRSFEYFAESINSKLGFYGKKCSSRDYHKKNCNGTSALMGSDRKILQFNGTYYFKTNKFVPFANGP